MVGDHPVAPTPGRRSERVLLRIPIEIEGRDAENKPFRETAFTLVVNRHGARISLRNSLRRGERITIRNLRTQAATPFRVVGNVGRSLGEGPEWGVECLDPKADFWGISFPEKMAKAQDQETVDALLECASCGQREFARLTLEQYGQVSTEDGLSRNCPRCGVERRWRFGSVESVTGAAQPSARPAAPASAKQAAPAVEKRQAKRLAVKLPLRVRLPDGSQEVTRTENLSKTGVCFMCDLNAELHQIIRLTVGYDEEKPAEEVAARVVWRKAVEGTQHFIYGVHLERKE